MPLDDGIKTVAGDLLGGRQRRRIRRPRCGCQVLAGTVARGQLRLLSVADVVGEITGKQPTEQQMITLAQNTPSGTAWHTGEESIVVTVPAG